MSSLLLLLEATFLRFCCNFLSYDLCPYWFVLRMYFWWTLPFQSRHVKDQSIGIVLKKSQTVHHFHYTTTNFKHWVQSRIDEKSGSGASPKTFFDLNRLTEEESKRVWRKVEETIKIWNFKKQNLSIWWFWVVLWRLF